MYSQCVTCLLETIELQDIANVQSWHQYGIQGHDALLCPYGFTFPDSKSHEANVGPIWGRQDPGGPHVGPMNFAIWVLLKDYILPGALIWSEGEPDKYYSHIIRQENTASQ